MTISRIKVVAAAACAWAVHAAFCSLVSAEEFVRVSPRDYHYLELSDGRPYVPIGLNLIAPNTRDEDGLARMSQWMDKLAASGGNYIRVWISSPFWDIEHERAGVYDESRARRIEEMLEMARQRGIRVKLTIEHFREMSDSPRQAWANKPLHLVKNGGTARDMGDFFQGDSSRAQFKKKLAWLKSRFGDNPTVFGWELWNEVNAVAARDQQYMPWTEEMLAELRKLFPHNLSLQSLGSFDSVRVTPLYRQHSLLPGNDIAQVHRYLDLGASLDVCHGPVDLLAADAVREILGYQPQKPAILAESGAVEPRHTGPFKLYGKDSAGMLLHDILFAPFFAGAAGAGQIWHWDSYVDRNNLWHHFGRFRETVKDLDPAAEHFQPRMLDHPRLRVYVLRGERTMLAWCRDPQNTWQSELEQERPPELVEQQTVDLGSLVGSLDGRTCQVYDPWTNTWSAGDLQGSQLKLPAFRRSIVIRVNPAQ